MPLQRAQPPQECPPAPADASGGAGAGSCRFCAAPILPGDRISPNPGRWFCENTNAAELLSRPGSGEPVLHRYTCPACREQPALNLD